MPRLARAAALEIMPWLRAITISPPACLISALPMRFRHRIGHDDEIFGPLSAGTMSLQHRQLHDAAQYSPKSEDDEQLRRGR